jgi:glycosyltransferase involved in cell wall biosynthesis
MTAPRFSVVINTYNGAAWLGTAIDSVLAQTLADWELIVWDDGSTDETVALARGYADPRIRVGVAERNAGLGAARNAAIALARGEWVAFLDQDDLWTADKLAGQDALIRADETGRLGLVYGRTRRFDARGEVGPFDPWYGETPLPEGDAFEALLAKPSFICLSSAVFRREVLVAMGPVPARIRFCTDYYLSVMVARTHSVACVQSLCCRYRVHDQNMSRVFLRQVHEEIMDIVATAARPAQHGILRTRLRVHNSLIGLDELRAGQVRQGAWRILRRGSVAYLTLRPVVARLRRLRHRVRQHRMISA